MNKNKKIIFIIAIIIIIATILIVKVIAENSSYAPEIKVTEYNGNKKTLEKGIEVTMGSASAFTYEDNPNVFCTEKGKEFEYWNTTYTVSEYHKVEDAKLAYILNISNDIGKNGYHYGNRGSKNNTKQRLLWKYIALYNNEDVKKLAGGKYGDDISLTEGTADYTEWENATDYSGKINNFNVEIEKCINSRR